jgi:pilus assembly protein CpaE
VEAITTAAVAEILRMLREQYDVVVIDAGSHVTTVQAAGVGLADEVFVVATPDLLCLRALKRVLRAWESVDVCEEPDVRILLNRVSRKSAVPVSDVARLVPAATVETVSVPASFRRLEESVNDRDPSLVRGRAWARAIMGITGAALAGVPGSDGSGGTSPVGDPALGGRRRARGDAGSVTIETVALIPKVLLAALLCWQVVLFAMSFVWAGHAADAAARAGARGGDADSAAKASVPPGFVDSVDATTSAGAVTVSFSVPVLAPGLLDLPFEIESTRRVVEEPS